MRLTPNGLKASAAVIGGVSCGVEEVGALESAVVAGFCSEMTGVGGLCGEKVGSGSSGVCGAAGVECSSDTGSFVAK